MTADEIAAAAAEMVAAGVAELHVHPKNADGTDTLDPERVAGVVTALRASVPGIPFGVTTGAWVEADPSRRIALIRAWDPALLPDYASVNWHEDGAQDVCRALLAIGVGVEAGLFSETAGPDLLSRSGMASSMHRVLAEVVETDPQLARRVAGEHYHRVIRVASATGRRPLLHGEEGGAWPVLRLAQSLAVDARIGLEDVLSDPSGAAVGATGNAALVRSARDRHRP